ncbi:MAG: CBS domain-containing protein [Candidatus Omnitrophota bacterium]
MLVNEMMTKDVITVSPDTSLKELGLIFNEKKISGAPVVDSYGNIVGVVTLTDLFKILHHIYICKGMGEGSTGVKLMEMREKEKENSKVRDIMTKDVISINDDQAIDDVMRLMFDKAIHTIPVTKEGKLIGVVGKRNLIYACF